MKILGIETSCDETSASVVENGVNVLSNITSSSQKLQRNYGGIIPEQAAREQVKYIIPVIQEAIKRSELKVQGLDAITVTFGPGLIGSLLIGVETAKTLSFAWRKPIIAINHLIGHIYANFINGQPKFPAICLIVSGGSTQLVLMKKHGEFKIIGRTRDDAAGECIDKCARLLGFNYPGGPEIEKAAKKFKPMTINHQSVVIKLPRPMINEDNFDFSFSGLKTAVLYLLKKLNQSPITNHQSSIAWEIQEAVTDILVKKTLMAAKKYQVQSILIGGGVAANQRLREKFKLAIENLLPVKGRSSSGRKTKLFIPHKKFCSDNAAMIASAAFFNYQPIPWSKIKPNPSLEIPSFQT